MTGMSQREVLLTTTAGVVIVPPLAALQIHVHMIPRHAQRDGMFAAHLRSRGAKDINKKDKSRT